MPANSPSLYHAALFVVVLREQGAARPNEREREPFVRSKETVQTERRMARADAPTPAHVLLVAVLTGKASWMHG
jgi:hypothetical protein